MSGMLLEDEVVLGVPGPYTWRGTVHTANISKDFLLKDKTQYFGPVTENESPVDKYSYLGEFISHKLIINATSNIDRLQLS